MSNVIVCHGLPVWHDGVVATIDRIRCLATDPVVMRLSPATDLYVVHCWLINQNKLNLLSWLLVDLSDK